MPSAIAERIALKLGAVGLVAVGLLAAGEAAGHAAFVDVTEVQAVAVHARYDTDAPMAEAQVAVFAPDDPAAPWRLGQTDAAGRFVFVPDDRTGRWAIQVRQAGHGAMGYVEVGASTTGTGGLTMPRPAAAGLDPLQRWLMVASVAWGCIGTALYFRRPARGKAG